ncbi:hypothetical protein LTR56_014888 [Elasticomyces elasticus]|nr:hypothetical protein LTR22_021191 [Elasticomyces elasticus]KAK3635116.1 hypothetical protein LTR56_014888 [Elasticomyces elasticus]KAK4909306.1 hypothetical protein LTR49_021897 [Elasticomyces elasticus]KAK5749901.1 hypothetical protein LTS12_020047 [Elasticomyces elasticus]
MDHETEHLEGADDSDGEYSAASDASGMFGCFDAENDDAYNLTAGTSHGTCVEVMMWRPLVGPDDIRIMVFEPATDQDAPVCFTFEITSLSAPRKYHALSYAWGQIEEDGSHLTDYVFIDGLGYKVSQHLNQGLKRIRQYWRDYSMKPALWADALCIDQANMAERSRQVALMGRIYAASQSLLIWLGESPLPVDLVQLQERSRRSLQNRSPIRLSRLSEYTVETILRNNRYFKRRWTLQEMLLQSRRTVLTYNFVFSFRAMEKDCHPFEGLEHTLPLMVRNEGELSRATLLENLTQYGIAECSDPRDRVYALLAVSYDDHGIRPDYRKSVEEVYIELAIHYICSGWATAILGYANLSPLIGAPETLVDVPSWVPDWRHIDSSSRSIQLKQEGHATVTEGKILDMEVWVTPCEHEQGASDDCAVCTTFEVPVALGVGVTWKSTLCECYIADSLVCLTLFTIVIDGEQQVLPMVKIGIDSEQLAAPMRLVPISTSMGETFRDAELVSWTAPYAKSEQLTRRVKLQRRTIRIV